VHLGDDALGGGRFGAGAGDDLALGGRHGIGLGAGDDLSRQQPVDQSTTRLRGRATSALAAAGRSKYTEGSFLASDGIAVPIAEVLELCDGASSACVFLVCRRSDAVADAYALASAALEGAPTVGDFIARLRDRIDGERIALVTPTDPR
jgi:hypothetical protein